MPVYTPIEHNSIERINEFYADPELRTQQVTAGRLALYQEILDRILNSEIDWSEADVCDVGCGTGHLLLAIKERFAPRSLTGFDVSIEALKILRKILPDAQCEELDIYLGVDKQFDVVFCSQVLEHLLYPERAMTQLLKMIKVGGTAVITVPEGRSDHYHGHINFWSPESWKVFLESFDEIEVLDAGMCGDARQYAILRRHVLTGQYSDRSRRQRQVGTSETYG